MLLKIITIFVLLSNVKVTCQWHFGRSVSWRIKAADNTKIQLRYRTIAASTIDGCSFNSTTRSAVQNSQDIAFDIVDIQDSSAKTSQNLTGDLYTCVDVCRTNNWFSSVYKDFEYTYGDRKEFYIGPAGDNFFTKVNVNSRTLQNTINNSPVAAIIPVITIPSGTTYKARISVVDPDFDKIKCRFANTSQEGASFHTLKSTGSSTNDPTISEQTCEVSIDTSGFQSGTYGVAVVIEDFESSSSTSSLSGVPLQFSVKIPVTNTSCGIMSYPDELLGDGECIKMTSLTKVVELIATTGCSQNKIEKFITSSPIGTLMSDTTTSLSASTPTLRTGVTYDKSTVTFNKTTWNDVENQFCFSALSTNGEMSNMRCWILVDESKSPSVGYDFIFPGPGTLHPLNLDTFTILFDSYFDTLPSTNKTLRIYDQSDGSMVTSINISTTCSACHVTSNNRLTITIPSPLPWSRGHTYYVQFDGGIATSPSGCVQSSVLYDKTSWTFTTNEFVSNADMTMDLSLFEDEKFDTKLMAPYEFALGNDLFVQMRLVGEVDSLRVVPQNCHVTRTPDQNSLDRYYILKDRCPVDTTYQAYNQSPLPKTYRFSFETVRFVGGNSETYLFCAVYICTNSSLETACNVDCSNSQKSRKRRSLQVHKNYRSEIQLQSGPIRLVQKQAQPLISVIEVVPYGRDKDLHKPDVIVYNSQQSMTQTFIIVFAAATCAIMTCYVIKLFFENLVSFPRHRIEQMDTIPFKS